MSFYDEPFNSASAHGKELLAIAQIGIVEKTRMKQFVALVGIDQLAVNWDTNVLDIWDEVLGKVAEAKLVREFLVAARDEENFVRVRDRIVGLLAVCDAEAENAAGAADAPPTLEQLAHTTLVGMRPFVNRLQLRDNLVSLFGPDGGRTMVVWGPPSSGRSYTWVLASHVARKFGGMSTWLVDLSTFTDTQATPVDVARMIASSLGWTDWPQESDIDPAAQDATNARVLRPQLVSRLSDLPPMCLFFDGLDGTNLTEGAVQFVGDIAAAAGNDQLGECRVVLLAYARAIPNPNVDPFVLREPPLGDIPLAEVKDYFKKVAGEAHTEVTDDQASSLVAKVFGTPVPDPVPMSAIGAKAAEISVAARGLRSV